MVIEAPYVDASLVTEGDCLDADHLRQDLVWCLGPDLHVDMTRGR
jgi:hypothetical protein